MIKIISFDIGNTIIKQSGKSKIAKIGEIINKNKKEFIQQYKEAFFINTKSIDYQIKDFLKKMKIKDDEDNNIYNKILKVFNDTLKKNTTVNQETIDLINKIKNKGYVVIAVSNCCKYTNNGYIEKLGIFDNVFYAYEFGYYKPDEKLFKKIEKILNVNANEILHIGDSINSDYYGCIANGWKAVFYDPNNKCEDEDVIKIEKLDEIEQYI